VKHSRNKKKEQAHPLPHGGTPVARRPFGVMTILFFTILFWIITLIYIGHLFFGGRIPTMSGASELERSYIAMFYWGLNITDLVWFQLLSLAAVIGLPRLTSWGWTAGIMLSVIWIYTTTFFIIGDFIVGAGVGQIAFWFFFLYGTLSLGYLWNMRRMFWAKEL